MKTKIKLAIFSIFAFCGIAKANSYWSQTLLNNPCVTSDTNVVVNVNQKNVSSLAMQVVYSSNSASSVSFGDGRVSTGSITVSSNSALTVASFSIAGYLLRAGRDWQVGGTSSDTAKSISDAIAATSGLNALIISTWAPTGIVTATSTVTGGSTQYLMTTSSQAALSLSGPNMAGGINSAYTLNSPLINVPDHGLSTGLAVLYSTASGVTIAPLRTASTYYAINVNSNSFELAFTSTGSLAGVGIVLTSTSTTGVHTFNLTPQNFSGAPGFYWQSSNDSVNWFTLPISSVTYSAPSNTMWNGPIDYQYLNFVYKSNGNSGCFNLKLLGNGR